MKEPRELTPKREELFAELDKLLYLNELTDAEWKKEITRIFAVKEQD